MAGKPTKKRVPKKKPGPAGLRISVLVIWLLVASYVGFAGWERIYGNELMLHAQEAQSKVNCNDPNGGFEYKGEIYCTMEDIAVEQHMELAENLGMGWGFFLPSPLPLILTALSFGAIGSLIRVFRTMIRTQELPGLEHTLLLPTVGGMTALMLLGISFAFPYIFSGLKILLKPTVVPFLSLFAGAFSDHIQKWFQTIMDKIFHIQKEKTDVT